MTRWPVITGLRQRAQSVRIRHKLVGLLLFLLIGSCLIQIVARGSLDRTAAYSKGLAKLDDGAGVARTWITYDARQMWAVVHSISRCSKDVVVNAKAPEFGQMAREHGLSFLGIIDSSSTAIYPTGRRFKLNAHVFHKKTGVVVSVLEGKPAMLAWADMGKGLHLVAVKPIDAKYVEHLDGMTAGAEMSLLIGDTWVYSADYDEHPTNDAKAVQRAAVKREGRLVHFRLGRQSYVTGARRINVSSDRPVRLVVTTKVDDAVPMLSTTGWARAALSIALVAVFAGLSLAVFRSLVVPIERLVLAVDEVRGGNLRVRVPVGSENEIGQLSRAFNEMVVSVSVSQAQLAEMANVDVVTHLRNHRCFQESLHAEIEMREKQGGVFSLLMLDIDDFKVINDNYGHQLGDLVLRQCAEAISRCLRRSDIAARYGGEEFVVLLPDTSIEQAAEVGNRIRSAVASTKFGSLGLDAISTTISCGVSVWPHHGGGRYALILAADTALRHAKREGKNRVTVFAPWLSRHYVTPFSHIELLLHDASLSAIEAVAATVDAKDPSAHRHTESVTRYCLALADAIGLSDKDREELKVAALLHDIGKIAVPDEVLKKQGPLSSTERQAIKNHAATGARILERIPSLLPVANSVRHHHERYDGTGYPDRLSGADIPLFARIIALADAFDAITSDRPYRRPSSAEFALDEIKRCFGTQFEPELGASFVKVMARSTLLKRRKAA